MKREPKGMMGIGALIIFIAIILIAAIAASVLITTGGSLQQKALITGSQTEEAIASGIEAMTVVASDASADDPQGSPHRVGDFIFTHHGVDLRRPDGRHPKQGPVLLP